MTPRTDQIIDRLTLPADVHKVVVWARRIHRDHPTARCVQIGDQLIAYTPDTRCDCHSYNWDNPDAPGTRPVALHPPPEIAATRTNPDRPIAVDACIADTVRQLWDAGIHTLGSCCGHNRETPELVLAAGMTDTDVRRAAVIIESCDSRQWRLLQWRLTDVSPDPHEVPR